MFSVYLFSVVFTSASLFFRSGSPKPRKTQQVRKASTKSVQSSEGLVVPSVFIGSDFDSDAVPQHPEQTEAPATSGDRYDQMTEDAVRTEARSRNIARVGVKGIKRLKDELRTQDFKSQLVSSTF